MKYLTIVLLSVLSIHLSYSQINEIGLFVGASNFIGDVGATNYISPNQLAFGGVYKWNRSARHSYKASLILTDLEGKDKNSDDPKRNIRNYSFSNKILEASIGMELTFLDFNLHSGEKKDTPYLFLGVSAANHDNFYFFEGKQTPEDESSWAFGIPFGLGYKTTFIDNFILSFEIGARYTFSDELDGSVPKQESLKPLRFGNINNTDWYVISGITLTYTFGTNPCYCLSY